MSHRRVTGKDLLNELKARVGEEVLREFERQANEQMLRQVGPVLEELKAKAEQVGPVGEAWARDLDRVLRRLRRAARRKGGSA